jgi:hypothetical protein
MGWGNCGFDKQGRPIGYVHEAYCDHPGCNKKIDRGLSYVCGTMHGEIEPNNQRIAFFWSTTLSRKGGHSIFLYDTPTKPTKRQLRKWMKEVKKSDNN